ncbi:FecCD family ABC transporter permease [Halobacillus naozhouensis]|uniref:Iron ABC transporter permease n=1 Tax=Halobacillus naozhouensis TaxID=554880 RepID=A0ABY8IX05_9BACI|nr:iron ABC transporter permease [Halobacillus naozhouensis]WFT74745.1 iron ABC transporter permease [Halobacillus naozhouensis]
MNKPLAYIGSLVLLVAAWLAGVAVGSLPIPLPVIIGAIAEAISPYQSNIDPINISIIVDVRTPRVVLAGLVGASLAIAGASFQGLLQNPLADPYTLGVSSGASVGAVLVLFVGFSFPVFASFTLPIVSICTAVLTLLFVIGFARMLDRTLSIETLILTGIVMGSFLGSVISLMIALTGEELRQIVGWLLGSVAMRGWSHVGLLLPFFIVGVLLLLTQGQELNAMSLGEERAKQLGVPTEKRKALILLAASILTGAAVAVSGTIGFVGLVVPHICRRVFGNDHRHLIPLSLINGATFLILADLVSRTIIAPVELPIGVITSLIGAPIFAFILYRQRRKGASI